MGGAPVTDDDMLEPTIKSKVVVPPKVRQLMEEERGHRSHRGLGDHMDPTSGSQDLSGTWRHRSSFPHPQGKAHHRSHHEKEEAVDIWGGMDDRSHGGREGTLSIGATQN